MSWTKTTLAATFQRMVEERHRSIGRNVAVMRKAHGWSQEELAHRAKVSVRTVSRLENGENEGRGQTLRLVADALEVEVSDLLADENTNVPELDQPGDVAPASQLDRIEQKLDTIINYFGAAAKADATSGFTELAEELERPVLNGGTQRSGTESERTGRSQEAP